VRLQKVGKLKRDLHFIGMPAANKHTVFVDSAQQAASFSAAEYFETPKVRCTVVSMGARGVCGRMGGVCSPAGSKRRQV
jgi:hypothetical protein